MSKYYTIKFDIILQYLSILQNEFKNIKNN